jgi:hypothetical protein
VFLLVFLDRDDRRDAAARHGWLRRSRPYRPSHGLAAAVAVLGRGGGC